MTESDNCKHCGGYYAGRENDHLKNCPNNPYISYTQKPPEAPSADVLSVLNDSNLLQRIVMEIGRTVVGEARTIQTVFLCACGANVANANLASYNLIVNSQSGAGKDYVVGKTLSILPKGRYIKRTRISERTFTYWHNPEFEPNWTWDGVTFYNEDISPNVLNSEVFKVMCSSGSSATVLIKQKPVDIEIRGKPVVICTTARAIPDKEILRRFAITSCDEGLDQTREIIKRQGQAAERGESVAYDEKITAALSHLKRVNVKISFGGRLAQKIPCDNIIARTAFLRLLDYIKASTALHQYQRQVDSDGYYIATKQDYEAAKVAFEKTTANQSFVPLTHEQQKLIELCKGMEAELTTQSSSTEAQQLIIPAKTEFAGFTVDEIADRCNFWEDRWLRTQLNNLAEMGIFKTGNKAVADSKKRAKTYRLQDTRSIRLPDWEEIGGENQNCMTCTADVKSQQTTEE